MSETFALPTAFEVQLMRPGLLEWRSLYRGSKIQAALEHADWRIRVSPKEYKFRVVRIRSDVIRGEV